MLIEIKAFDTLFFRNGRPFTMKNETWANSIFPPYPSTIYGALRSAYFSNHIDEFDKANTCEDPTKDLIINDIFYRVNNENYYQLPLDLVIAKDEDKDANNEYKISLLEYKSSEGFESSANPNINLLYSKEEVESLNNGLIADIYLSEYLDGNANKLKARSMEECIKIESKVSIGIDDITHASGDRLLYIEDMIRPHGITICVDFSGIDLPESGFMKLGGEGKVSYYFTRKNVKSYIDKMNFSGNKFKLYLSTPAVFKNGWLPGWVDKNTLEGDIFGLRLKLKAAVIGRYIPVGGFDVKKREPKIMYKAVPAGSVYYFEVLNDNACKIFKLLDGKSISEFDTAKEGFGICKIGRW
ncbi:type III-B CRISPR module-associated protein Cmr3 [Thermoanaerobacterium thermosaccharolyticum]|uniref:type III-B CRISPR module-associated protein Cmr3 n=1 Tax=Thermoanaerobacterium thermosaccharolyticum TaxID=1517 RepID=UPI003DA98470